MLLFIKKAGFILLVFISISTIISFGSLWSLRQSSFYKPSFLVNNVLEKEFDYIILGASTGLTTLNTRVIDSVLHTNGLNLSMDDTALSSQHLMLEHFLAQGKIVKFCVVAPSINDYDVKSNVLSGNDYRFLPYINTSYVSNHYNRYSSQSAKLLYGSKWLPILGVSYYNTEIFYPSLLALINPKKRNRFDEKGNYGYPNKNAKSRSITEFKELPISFQNIYLEKISDLCKLNNIKLICYFSPINAKKVVTETDDYTILNHSDLLKNTSFFYDDIHVNYKGRQISSEAFANDFKLMIK
ncbi:hypothetical protein [uncultured Winogradskyella sp.]|uniref:hypothetical protein n=1 Tax=uncultured Winogradskyella sp. TaxID=395353 RepID=UPI0026121EFE|nr:hypothetical protein [uncultured Winogradskyella sp.]